ncbi:MAG: LacI family DNA-binding transcriptional regulator [candidate division NC10 bacterium]|nr:LacI family DNA-binding transcriptional regulator [candidate division NC10 bacterium]
MAADHQRRGRQPRVTISDVARQAGVSLATVSHVLNKRSTHVGGATRTRVLQVIREMGYRPSAVAQSLAARRTSTIGLIVADVADPFFAPIAMGVEQAAERQGYGVLLCQASSLAAERRYAAVLEAKRVDGVIVASHSVRRPNAHLLALVERGIPMVAVNRPLQPGSVDWVGFDYAGAAVAAVAHLVNLGHRTLGCVTGPVTGRAAYRSGRGAVEGFRLGLQAAGLRPVPRWVQTAPLSYDAGFALGREIARWPSRPRAFVVASEDLALATVRGLRFAGLRVPQDVALVSLGDAPFVEYTEPPLSAVRFPLEASGRRAMALLLQRLQHPHCPLAQEILRGDLIVRQSCGACVVTDATSRMGRQHTRTAKERR